MCAAICGGVALVYGIAALVPEGEPVKVKIED
ncbi:hypothetical protein BJ980_000613 [Nocardioides daedukensis]|uniref:Uncharacterized protein n=1 Tax=Nocardioides daedukensis TaxID=634462 RepID=A0A7Y9UVK6_9ACTN|nr:hypothetical protein [Nocardioides daedukensis]